MWQKVILWVASISLGLMITAGGVLRIWHRTGDSKLDVVNASRHRALRERYPIENLAPRLEYEQAVLADSSSAFRTAYSAPKALSPTVLKRLQADGEGKSYRSNALADLHRRGANEFIRRPLNGVSRIISPADLLELEPLESEKTLPLPEYSNTDSFPVIDGKTIRTSPPDGGGDASAAAIPARDALLQLHSDGSTGFLDRNFFGATMDKQLVSGFVTHRFYGQMPPVKTSTDDQVWSITRLELVSLLKHNEPRVYVSKELPRLAELKDVPTRPLDEFENASLKELWHDEDIIIVEEPQRIRMLGSLRAQQTCLDCHSVELGQLLGAFSYELQLRRTMPPDGSDNADQQRRHLSKR